MLACIGTGSEPVPEESPEGGTMASCSPIDTAAVLRNQFRTLELVSQPLMVDADRQRRMLLLDRGDWVRWSNFRHNGALPPHPDASVMLRRLGTATFRLASLAERSAD